MAGEAENIEANTSTAQSVASQLQASYHITSTPIFNAGCNYNTECNVILVSAQAR